MSVGPRLGSSSTKPPSHRGVPSVEGVEPCPTEDVLEERTSGEIQLNSITASLGHRHGMTSTEVPGSVLSNVRV